MNDSLKKTKRKPWSAFFRYFMASSLAGGALVAAAEYIPALPSVGTPLIEPARPVMFAVAASTPPAERKRIAFYNIEMFTDGIQDGKNRTVEQARNQAANAAAIINELDADILFISEIENETAMEYLNHALARPFPQGYIVTFGTGGRRTEKMNIGMLSRVPPESVHEVDFGPLTGEGRPTRGLFRAIFPLGDRHYLLVYAAHLKANWGDKTKNYAQRFHAMKIMQEDIKQVTSAQDGREWEIIALGDYNTDPLLPDFQDDPTLKVLTGWHDLWAEHPEIQSITTLPTRYGDPALEFPPATFDRVLANPSTRTPPWTVSLPSVLPRGTETNNVKVLPGQGIHVSDHYPIYVDFTR